MAWMSMAQQAFLRLIVSIGLLVLLLGVGSYFAYSAATEKFTRERAQDLAFFYSARLQQLEREWELQTQDFKVRVEVSRLLDDPHTATSSMQAFMTVQGTNRRFEHLLIEDGGGQKVFSFGTGVDRETLPADVRRNVEARGDRSGQGWYRIHRHLYRVFVVPIWLGARGNGSMALFYKIDNALLFNISAPDITLSVSHRGEALASSAGFGALDLLRSTGRRPTADETGVRNIAWEGKGGSETLLHIHAPVKALFSQSELVVAAAVIPLIDGLILWFTLGFWLMRNARRVKALRGAVVAFSDDHKATPVFAHALAEAHGTRDDEISIVADALDDMAAEAARRDHERSQEEAQRQLWSRVFASSIDAILISDSNNRIVSVNQAFSRLTGYEEAEIIGHDPHRLSAGLESPEFYAVMWHEIASTGQWSGEVTDRRKDGSTYPKWLNISVVRNAQGEVVNYIGVFKDITEQKQNEERFVHLASHDTLTDLPNRHLLLDRLRKAIGLASRHEQLVALLFLDLDNFKWVNDSLGHAAGDKLLIAVGERLTAAVRGSDTVARLGGDEFVILLMQPTGNHEIALIADKISTAVAQPLALGGHDFHVTTSIGISVYPNDGDDPATLLKHADTALYAAKAAGKNEYRFFDAPMNRAATERIELERDLRAALKREEFLLHYQPKFCVRTNSICSAEALIRWQHPAKGMVPPDRFIPLAEETALIIEIGEWVIRTACRQLAAWQAQGLHLRSIAVNLSAIQVESDTFVAVVERILAETGVAPSGIEFELTESAVLRNPERSLVTLARLRELGFSLALDDFGTGYSSLSYLKRLPLDTLKIDRSFVQGLPDDADDAQIVRMIIALAKSVRMQVVAEGIETPAQRDFLTDLGCEFLQGYLIAKPLPAADFGRLMTTTGGARCGLHQVCALRLDCALA